MQTPSADQLIAQRIGELTLQSAHMAVRLDQLVAALAKEKARADDAEAKLKAAEAGTIYDKDQG